MHHFRTIRAHLGRFRDSESGSFSIEAAFWIPFVFSIIGATLVIGDGFRHKALGIKANYVVGDALSRETNALDDEYLSGMLTLLDVMAGGRAVSEGVRTTLVTKDGDTDALVMEWSHAAGSYQPRSESDLAQLSAALPDMVADESLLVVETRTQYDPIDGLSNVLVDTTFENMTTIRPRFSPQIVWSDGS